MESKACPPPIPRPPRVKISASDYIDFSHSVELQGHAIKNQDLLVASGVTSLKGTDALTAVDEDIEAAVWVPPPFHSHVLTRPLSRPVEESAG